MKNLQSKTLIIIPARAGSKGVKYKNRALLNGVPLIEYTIAVFEKLGHNFKAVLTSDDNWIIENYKDSFDHIIVRDSNLSSDDSSMASVLIDAIKKSEEALSQEFDVIILLQPTSPLRRDLDVIRAYEKYNASLADLVVSVCECRENPYYTVLEKDEAGFYIKSKDSNVIRRQDVPLCYNINGAVYIFNKQAFLKFKNLTKLRTDIYVMPKERSIDIDDDIDMKIASLLLI